MRFTRESRQFSADRGRGDEVREEIGLIATVTAYGFSRFIISTQTVPAITLLIPYFGMVVAFGIFDTYFALILTYLVFTLPYAILLMTTAHEPAYPEDGMPKGRYRAYHVERAKAGLALTVTAGSAAVAEDSPPAFNNILAYKDEVVPWMKELTDACHEQCTAVMIQLSHLGRRTR